MAEVELTYGQLETVLVTNLQVRPERLSTFRSRMKQLQRLSFPTGVNVGRGAKMTYSSQHLLQLALAFELIDIGIPSDRATKAVIAGWEMFSVGFGVAMCDQILGIGKHRVFARVFLNSMRDIQFATDASRETFVLIENSETLASTTTSAAPVLRDTYIIICLSHLLETLLKFSHVFAGIKGALVDTEPLSWRPMGKPIWLRFDALEGVFDLAVTRAHHLMESDADGDDPQA